MKNVKYSDKEIIAAINVVHKILDLEEFSLDVSEYDSNITDVQELKFNLIDQQSANLGGIELEAFNNLAGVIDRMDGYHNDYLYEAYDRRVNAGEVIPQDDWDRKIIIFLESDYCADLLSSISAATYTDYVHTSYGKFYDKAEDRLKENDGVDELSLLIDKSIALKILDTESAYMMVEYNGKIYINTDDVEFDTPEEFLKELKKYFNNSTDDKFFYEYDNYSEVIQAEKGLILDDFGDIGFYDDNGCWNFYLSEDELKYIGLEKELDFFESEELFINDDISLEDSLDLLGVNVDELITNAAARSEPFNDNNKTKDDLEK